MAQELESKSLIHSDQSQSFPKIASFFNALEYIIERTGHLIGKSEFLIFKLSFWLFLIYKMAEYGWYLLKNWH